MFGHDDNSKKNDDADNMVTDEVVQEAAAPADDVTSPAYIPTPPGQTTDTPADEDVAEGAPSVEPTTPADEPITEPAQPEPATVPQLPTTNNSDDLINIKQTALQQLSPLVGHLDQTPEEKFRTTMMMIQASDNQALIKDAYAAAQAITDDKTRAQALLDIINEINYFTRQP